MKKKYLSVLIFFIIISLVTGIIAYRYFFIPKGIHINKSRYPITGIDISKHSGIIDWSEIDNQHIDFVYIKATEGQTYIDPNYSMNVRGAKGTHMKVGDYHFFRFNRSGVKQAENYLTHTRLTNIVLPPVLDVEEWGNFHTEKNVAEIKLEIKDFLKVVEPVIQRKVIIYTNKSTYNKFIRNEFPDNPIWICSFIESEIMPDKREWLFWQHAHNGRIKGIEGYVDVNTFNGNRSEWKKYAY